MKKKKINNKEKIEETKFVKNREDKKFEKKKQKRERKQE